MLKDKIQKALNAQLNLEMASSYLYLSMATYFENVNFNGFASWMKIQSGEEYGHAMKIYSYINQRNGKVNLMKIDAPKSEWKDAVEVFSDTLKHEQNVTEKIGNLVELSLTDKDYATNTFLQWFVTEQVEEEATAINILDKIKMIGDNRNGLFLLDRELGMRAAR
ncbi:MAG TPA: ferritin [Ignavibacteriaceae bacterium]|nr:ferritin [Ignavibacteriaceae bacterium]